MVPPEPVTVTWPVPVAWTVALFTVTPLKLPVVGTACVFALNVNAPSTVVRLDPELNKISLAVVMLIPFDPVKLVAPLNVTSPGALEDRETFTLCL